jgi:hypothetical protein
MMPLFYYKTKWKIKIVLDFSKGFSTERDRRELSFESFLQFAINIFKYSHSTITKNRRSLNKIQQVNFAAFSMIIYNFFIIYAWCQIKVDSSDECRSFTLSAIFNWLLFFNLRNSTDLNKNKILIKNCSMKVIFLLNINQVMLVGC